MTDRAARRCTAPAAPRRASRRRRRSTEGRDPLTAIPAVWDFAAKALRKLDFPPSSTASWTAFLPDSHRLLVSSGGALMLVDLAGGKPRRLRAGAPGDLYRLSRDGRTLVLEHPVFDSDIWLMDLGDKGR